MTIRFKCTCGKKLRAPDDMRSKIGRCPGCLRSVKIPEGSDESPSDQEARANAGEYFTDMGRGLIGLLDAKNQETKAGQSQYTPEEIYERVVGAVVVVDTSSGTGSGVVIDSDGIIVTNRHVVSRDDSVVLRFSDGKSVSGKTIRACRDVDLAFIQADGPVGQFLEFATNRSVRVGQSVFAIGHPIGLQNTFTTGVISAIDRPLDGISYLQTDAAVNTGNSGGPLLDSYGQVVGLVTKLMKDSQGIALAIPVDLCRRKYLEVRREIEEMREGHYCATCGNRSAIGFYCNHCGTQIGQSSGTGGTVQEKACSKCGNSLSLADHSCPTCGLAIETGTREDPERAEVGPDSLLTRGSNDSSSLLESIQTIAGMVERLLDAIGVDPSENRVIAEDVLGWVLPLATGPVYINLRQENPFPTVSVTAPLLSLPANNILPLYRRLLEENMEMVDCSFAVTADTVFLVSERPTLGLDDAELKHMVYGLACKAESMTERLAEEFGARKCVDELP